MKVIKLLYITYIFMFISLADVAFEFNDNYYVDRFVFFTCLAGVYFCIWCLIKIIVSEMISEQEG